MKGGVFLKVVGDHVWNDDLNISKKAQDNDNKQIEALFKKVLIEKMFSEMFKSTKVIPGTSDFEKEIYTEKMSEMLADKFIESTDIRWQELINQTQKLKTNDID